MCDDRHDTSRHDRAPRVPHGGLEALERDHHGRRGEAPSSASRPENWELISSFSLCVPRLLRGEILSRAGRTARPLPALCREIGEDAPAWFVAPPPRTLDFKRA